MDTDTICWLLGSLGVLSFLLLALYRLAQNARESRGAGPAADPMERLQSLVDRLDTEPAPGPTASLGVGAGGGTGFIIRDLPSIPEDIYFSILGLDRKTADRKALEEAYHLAAVKNHPDKNLNDPYAARRFRTIEDAYEQVRKFLSVRSAS